MRFWATCIWRGTRRCPECGARWCAVYSALGTRRPSPSIYARHRGFWL